MIKHILFFLLLSITQIAPAVAMPRIIAVNSASNSGEESISIIINEAINHQKVFLLKNPHRLVIDLDKVTSNGISLPSKHNKKIIKSIRFGDFDHNTSRIVLNLSNKTVTAKLKHIKATAKSPYKIVVSLKLKNDNRKHIVTYKALKNSDKSTFSHIPKAKPKPPKSKIRGIQKPLIIIDAGHGGKDPGATGASGKYEKHITLTYAKKLKMALKRTGRYRVKLTRDNDVFILLRKRVEIAQKAGGNIFISIHADSALEKSARGLSIYTVSEKASNKAAAALARQENKADYIGETSANITHEDETIVDILLDLTRRDTKNKSSRLADLMVKSFKRKNIHTLSQAHQFAGFRVLKAPDIPSVLVELGFLTNRKDETLLKQKNYQNKITSGIIATLDSYFK